MADQPGEIWLNGRGEKKLYPAFAFDIGAALDPANLVDRPAFASPGDGGDLGVEQLLGGILELGVGIALVDRVPAHEVVRGDYDPVGHGLTRIDLGDGQQDQPLLSHGQAIGRAHQIVVLGDNVRRNHRFIAGVAVWLCGDAISRDDVSHASIPVKSHSGC